MDKQNGSAAETSDSLGSAVTASPERADEIFLEGPRSRFGELITLFRVMWDFLRGFRMLHFVGSVRDRFRLGAGEAGKPAL